MTTTFRSSLAALLLVACGQPPEESRIEFQYPASADELEALAMISDQQIVDLTVDDLGVVEVHQADLHGIWGTASWRSIWIHHTLSECHRARTLMHEFLHLLARHQGMDHPQHSDEWIWELDLELKSRLTCRGGDGHEAAGVD